MNNDIKLVMALTAMVCIAIAIARYSAHADDGQPLITPQQAKQIDHDMKALKEAKGWVIDDPKIQFRTVDDKNESRVLAEIKRGKITRIESAPSSMSFGNTVPTALTFFGDGKSIIISLETGKVTIKGYKDLDEASTAFWKDVERNFNLRTKCEDE